MTKAATGYLKSPKLSDADIARGKATLKAEILYAADNEPALLESLGQQALLKGRLYKPSTLVAEVEKVTASEVKSVRFFFFPDFLSHQFAHFKIFFAQSQEKDFAPVRFPSRIYRMSHFNISPLFFKIFDCTIVQQKYFKQKVVQFEGGRKRYY